MTGALLWQVTLAWQRAMRATLEPHDLTHVQFVLLATAAALASADAGPPTQDRVAARSGADEAMTAQVLRRLAARQLVTRELDRRITLTPAGASVLKAAAEDVAITEAEFFAVLGTDEQFFRRCLEDLTQ